MRIRQPGVKREERNLNRKSNKEAKKKPERSATKAGHAPVVNRILNYDEIKAAGLRIQPQNRRQHKHRADKGKEEILDRRIYLASMAVHADQQRHWNQSRFPEEIEQEQIKRGEDADQRRLQNQQQNEKFFHALVNRGPGDQHAQRREKSGQHHQPHGDPINSHVVVNVWRRNPDLIDLVPESAGLAVQMRRQMQRGDKRQHGNNEGKQPDIAIAPWDQENQQSAPCGNKCHERQNERADSVHVHFVTPIQTM